MTLKIVSGGQTGVDQAGLEAAVELGLDFGGWAPHGWIAENGMVPAPYRGRMKEHPDCGSRGRNYRTRTLANIRDSQATLILVERLPLEGGTKLTNDFAASIGRSHRVVNIALDSAKADAEKWLDEILSGARALVLNIAGPRESKAPGIQVRARAFLTEVLRSVLDHG